MSRKRKIDLVQVIRDNPGCVATIDNDCWRLRKSDSLPSDFDNWTAESQDKFIEEITLATSRDEIAYVKGAGDYGGGGCYGDDILMALAKIVGIKVNSA
jgi:hypothetical protein